MSKPTEWHGRQAFADPVSFTDVFELQPDDGAGDADGGASVYDQVASSNANKRWSHDKIVQRLELHHRQADGADVASATELLAVMTKASQLVGVTVRPTTAPAGGDKAVSVDVQKAASGSGSWSSLLDSAVSLADGDADDTKKEATLAATPTLADGDAVRVVVTASGSTGSQAQGLVVVISIKDKQD